MESDQTSTGVNEDEALASIKTSHAALAESIQQKISERNELKIIIQKQLENINELQKKCEESYIAVDQLPQNKLLSSESYDKAINLIHRLQHKQLKVNELLNFSIKEFEDVSLLKDNAKSQFKSEVGQANQRHMVYQLNLHELNLTSNKIKQSIEKNIKERTFHLNLLEKYKHGNMIQKLENDLSDIKSEISKVKLKNNEIEETTSLVESSLISISDKTQTLQNTMNNKLASCEEEMNNFKSILEEKKKELSYNLNQRLSVSLENEKLQNDCDFLKEKLSQLMEKINIKAQEISLKQTEVDVVKNELETSMMASQKLQETEKQIDEYKEICSLTESRVNKLLQEKNELISKRDNLISDINLTNENIDKKKVTIKKRLTDIQKVKDDYVVCNSIIRNIQETHDEETNSSQKKLLELNEEINKLNYKNKSIKDSIKTKKNILEELQSSLNSKNEENRCIKKELNELKEKNKHKKQELNEKLASIKLKVTEVSQEIEMKQEELKQKRLLKETIDTLSKDVAEQKAEHSQLLETSEQEKADLKIMFNEKLEAKLTELQEMKKEKQSELDKTNDEASKAEFTYYSLKRRLQRSKGEINCIKETLKTYNCENETLHMLLGWLKSDSQISSFNQEGTMNLDHEEMEEMDMIVQEYQIPHVDKEASYREVSQFKHSNNESLKGSQNHFFKEPSLGRGIYLTPSSKRKSVSLSQWKRAKKEPEKKTILDLVLDSTDSQSSA